MDEGEFEEGEISEEEVPTVLEEKSPNKDEETVLGDISPRPNGDQNEELMSNKAHRHKDRKHKKREKSHHKKRHHAKIASINEVTEDENVRKKRKHDRRRNNAIDQDVDDNYVEFSVSNGSRSKPAYFGSDNDFRRDEDRIMGLDQNHTGTNLNDRRQSGGDFPSEGSSVADNDVQDSRLMDALSDEDMLDPSVGIHERKGIFSSIAKEDGKRRGGDRRNKKRRSNKDREYWRKRKEREEKEALRRLEQREIDKPRCRYYMEGRCGKSANCPFSHDFKPPKKMEVCKFYAISTCLKGEHCVYMHSDFPCKFFHAGKHCPHKDDCKFSHDLLTPETKVILERFVEERPFPLNDEDRFDSMGNNLRLHQEEINYDHENSNVPKRSLLGSPPQHVKDLARLNRLGGRGIGTNISMGMDGMGSGSGRAMDESECAIPSLLDLNIESQRDDALLESKMNRINEASDDRFFMDGRIGPHLDSGGCNPIKNNDMGGCLGGNFISPPPGYGGNCGVPFGLRSMPPPGMGPSQMRMNAGGLPMVHLNMGSPIANQMMSSFGPRGIQPPVGMNMGPPPGMHPMNGPMPPMHLNIPPPNMRLAHFNNMNRVPFHPGNCMMGSNASLPPIHCNENQLNALASEVMRAFNSASNSEGSQSQSQTLRSTAIDYLDEVSAVTGDKDDRNLGAILRKLRNDRPASPSTQMESQQIASDKQHSLRFNVLEQNTFSSAVKEEFSPPTIKKDIVDDDAESYITKISSKTLPEASYMLTEAQIKTEPDEPQKSDVMSCAQNGSGVSNLLSMRWRLVPLDVPAKIPYSLMKLPSDLPHLRNDPRLRGALRVPAANVAGIEAFRGAPPSMPAALANPPTVVRPIIQNKQESATLVDQQASSATAIPSDSNLKEITSLSGEITTLHRTSNPSLVAETLCVRSFGGADCNNLPQLPQLDFPVADAIGAITEVNSGSSGTSAQLSNSLGGLRPTTGLLNRPKPGPPPKMQLNQRAAGAGSVSITPPNIGVPTCTATSASSSTVVENNVATAPTFPICTDVDSSASTNRSYINDPRFKRKKRESINAMCDDTNSPQAHNMRPLLQ